VLSETQKESYTGRQRNKKDGISLLEFTNGGGRERLTTRTALLEAMGDLRKFVDMANEELPVAPRHLRVGNVYHVVIDVELDIGAGEVFAGEGMAAVPDGGVSLVFEAEQVGAARGLVHLQERCQLGGGNGRVQLQVAADGRDLTLSHLLVHLRQEYPRLKPQCLLVVLVLLQLHLMYHVTFD